MKQCIQNNFRGIELPTLMAFQLGGGDVYTTILSNLISNFKTDDSSQFLAYLTDPSSITDQDLLTNSSMVVTNVMSMGAPFGYQPAQMLEGFKQAAIALKADQEVETAPVQISSKQDAATDIETVTETPATSETEADPMSYDIPSNAKVSKLGAKSAKTLPNVLAHYLPGELSTKSYVISNTFRKLISKNWLSTEANKKVKDNFDFATISKNMKADASATIHNYYEKSADALSTFDQNMVRKKLLYYTDINRIPGDAESIADLGNGIVAYKSDYVDGIIILAPEAALIPGIDVITGKLDQELPGATQLGDFAYNNAFELTPDEKPPRVSTDSALQNIDNDTLLTAYASHAILNEFDIFVADDVPELSSMYNEEYRTGPIRIDVIGSNQATKFTRLGLLSTPKIHESSNNTQTLNKINGISNRINREGKNPFYYLKNLDLIKNINSNGDKAFKVGDNSNIVINVGTANVIFTHAVVDGEKQWVINFPDANTGARQDYEDTIQLRLDRSPELSTEFISGVESVLELLNISDFSDMALEDITTTSMGSFEASKLMDQINSVETLYSNKDTFNVSTFEGETQDSFINPMLVSSSAGILANIPHDIDKAGDYLLKESKKKGPHANIARALYYKYFHKGEYKITEINHVTGLLETATHLSLYEKARRYGDSISWNALVGLMSQIQSTVLDNKVFLSNNYLIRSSIQNSDNVDFLINSINLEGLEDSNGVHILPEANVNRFFKVSTTGNTQLTTIQYFKYGHDVQGKPEPTVEFKITKKGDVKSDDASFTFPVIQEMMNVLKLPKNIKDINLYDSMKTALSGKTDPSDSANSFYGKLISLRLANVANQSNVYTYNTNLKISQGKPYKFGFQNNLNTFRESLENATSNTFSRTYSSVFTGPTGSDFATTIYANLSKKKKAYINKLLEDKGLVDFSSLLKDSAFVRDGGLFEIVEELTRLGLKVGQEGKDTRNLDQQELLATMVNSFIQYSGTREFKEGLTSEGTMSDRSKIDAFIVRLKNGDIAPYIKSKNHELDENVLRDRYHGIQERSFNALQDHVVTKWIEAINSLDSLSNLKGKTSSLKTIRDVYNLLQENEVNYEEVLRYSDLVDNFTIVKGKGGRATINYSMVQLSEVVLAPIPQEGIKYKAAEKKALQENLDKRNFYLDMYHNEFMDYARDIGYEISPKEISVLENRFTYLKDLKGEKKIDAAKALALKIFFYNDSMFEQELIQFGMGHVFQYKTKAKSMFEQINKNADGKTLTNREIISQIEDFNFGSDKAPINVKMGYTQLKDIGIDGNAASSIKSILDSKMPLKDKVAIIEYIDTFTQISPQYVDRVKRNQASGTSGLGPVLAQTNKPGMYLDQTSKTITVVDPTKTTFTLNSGDAGVDTFDGSQIISPSYAYKLNKSIGDRFANFRSTSFFKTVNPSKTKDGIAQYEKLAAFSTYTWELMTYGTPEHHSVHKLMMNKEKFSNPKFSKDYNGLYLYKQSDLKNPETAAFTETLNGASIAEQMQEFKKHGEYLGKLKVTTKKGTEFMEAPYLMVALEEGKLKEADILSINTNKIFVDSTKINSKWDLYNYYGGIKTNLEMLQLNQTESGKETFMNEFPFGWVEYQVSNIMSNYRGNENNFPIRNAEINKINFVSTMKTGRQNINPTDVLNSKYIDEDSVSTSEVSNEFLNIILSAEHHSDVSAEMSITSAHENNTIAMLTQVMSNSVAEGNTKFEVGLMNEALSQLSDLQLKQLQAEVTSYSTLAAGTDSTAEKQFVVNLLRDIIKTRKDPGSTADALGITEEDAANLSMDLRMIHPILRSSINAEYNKRGIKLRFAGGQYVLSPIDNQIKLYNFGATKGLMRSTVFPVSDEAGQESHNSVNGLLKKEITSPTFNGVLSDPSWKLRPVTSMTQLEAEHSVLDYVYKVVKPATDTEPAKYEAVLVQDMITNTVSEDLIDIVSPWMDATIEEGTESPNGAKGNDLQWMNYFKDGQSLYDTDEFLSYYLSGKAPKELSNMTDEGATLGQKLDYLRQELGAKEPAVPRLMWSRFIIDLKNRTEGDQTWLDFVGTLPGNAALIGSRVIGPASIDAMYVAFKEAMTGFAEGNEAHSQLLQAFVDYVESRVGDEKNYSNLMKSQLKYILKQDGWKTSEAEFFMPPQHQAAFLIEFGDSINDIVGVQEQPDVPKLASILNLSDDEVSLLERFYIHSEDNARIKELKEKIKQSKSPEAEKYLRLRRTQQHAMKDYFEKKVKKVRDAVSTATSSEVKALKKRAPIFLLENSVKEFTNTPATSQQKEGFNKMLNSLLNSKEVTSNIDLLTSLLDIKELANDIDTNKITIKTAVNKAADDYAIKWEETLADNFEKSLTFLTARIPSQAKQQTALGKIKGFIYSTKNAIYSPIELIALSGADYDIDKQNNVTWNVDSMGKIIDWEYITVGSGKLSLDNAMNGITDAVTRYKQQLKRQVDEHGNPLTKTQVFKKANEFKKIQLEELKKATQNFIVNQLLTIAGSSKNAIETSTSVAMNKLGVIRDFIASFNFSDLDVAKYNLEKDENGRVVASPELYKLIKKRQLAIPYTPSTKMFYEKVNMDGKVGISTFASAIKAYMAVFNASISNNTTNTFDRKLGEVINGMGIGEELNLEETYEKTNASITNDELKYIEFGKQEDGYVKAIWKDSATGLYLEGKELIYPANSEKFMPKVANKEIYPLLNTKLAKKAYQDMLHVVPNEATGETQAEAEAAILLRYKDSLDSDGEYDMESQAWQDLAELLSASTDNAKELILSAIGANNTTSSIIATMVSMGVDLKAALLIINDEIIQKEVKLHESDKSLIGKQKDFIEPFKTRLNNLIPKYANDNKLDQKDIKEIEDKIKKYHPDFTKKEVNAELIRQQELHKKYNPASQLALFSEASQEFTNLSGIFTINTGMANSELDTFNFLLKVERAIKSSSTTGTLEQFLDEEDATARNKMIEEANKNKIAFNIPYIIHKNKPFFNYIKTLFEANKLIKGMSYTTAILDETIKPLIKRAGKTRVELGDLIEYNSLLSNIALSTYYKSDNVESTLEIPTLGTSYDLSDTAGRLAFVKDLAKIKDSLMAEEPKLGELKLLTDLQLSDTRTNMETGKSITLFAGINVKNKENFDIADYKLNLQDIKRLSPKLYEVLTQYSLIVDKGGLGKSSIASLIGYDNIKKFNDHILDLQKTGKMQEIVSGMSEQGLLGVALPVVLKELSTLKGSRNETQLFKLKNGHIEGLENSEELAEFNSSQEEHQESSNAEAMYDIADDMDQEQFNQYAKESALSAKFDVSNVNKIRDEGTHFIKNAFKSKTNGLIYHYFEAELNTEITNEEGAKQIRFESYVPVTKDVDGIVGNIDISDADSSIASMGYNWGWEIVLQDGRKGRLLSHSSGANYFVLNELNNKVSEVSANEIQTYNPQFLLSDKAIIVRRGSYQAADSPAIYWETKDGENVLAKQPSEYTRAMYIGSHMTYRRGYEDMTNQLRVEPSVLEKKRFSSKDITDFEAINRGDYNNVIDNMFLAILVNAKLTRNNNNISDETEPIVYGDTDVKALIDTRKIAMNSLSKVVTNDNDQRIIDFRNSLMNDKNQLYVFLRKTDKQKLDYINNNVLNPDLSLETVYPSNRYARQQLKLDQTNRNEITFTDVNTAVKSDVEFLLQPDLKGVTIQQYTEILNKLGISTNEYRKLVGGNLDLLIVDNKVYMADNYANINRQAGIKYSVDVNTDLSPVENTKKIKKVSPKVVSRMASFLNKRFSDATVKVMSLEDIAIQYPGLDFTDSDQAFVKPDNGTIILIKNRFTLDTLLHEMGHLYLADLKSKDFELYLSILEKMEGDPIFDTVNEAYVNKNSYTKEDILEEAFIYKLQKMYAKDFTNTFLLEETEQMDGILNNGESTFGDVTDTLSTMFEEFLGGKLKKGETLSMTDSLADIMRKIGADLIFNKNSALNNMNKNDIKSLKNILKYKKMTKNQAIKYLTDRGLMRKICN